MTAHTAPVVSGSLDLQHLMRSQEHGLAADILALQHSTTLLDLPDLPDLPAHIDGPRNWTGPGSDRSIARTLQVDRPEVKAAHGEFSGKLPSVPGFDFSATN